MLEFGRGIGFIGVLLGLPFLAGCAGGPGVTREGPPAEAPTYQVGDRWVYQAQDGFRLPVVWEEVHEVTAVDGSGITIGVTQRGPSVNNDRTEILAAPGLVRQGAVFDAETRIFKTPLTRYAFPLKPGQSWREWVDNFNQTTGQSGQFSHWVWVDGWGQVTTPSGTYDALRLRISMRLDDETPWRFATECSYVAWYAPAVRGIVQMDKEATYIEKGQGPPARLIRSQHATMALVSFTPGRK